MRNRLRLGMMVWGGLLLLALWLMFFSGLAAVKYGVATALIVVMAVPLLRLSQRSPDAPVGVDDDLNLPAETWRQPVVLVTGDAAARLFAGHPSRQIGAGFYLHAVDETQLAPLVDRVLTLRPGWASQICVVRIVLPELHKDGAVLKQQMREGAQNLAEVRYRTGACIPSMLWSYLPEDRQQESQPWFIRSGNRMQVAAVSADSSPADWITRAAPAFRYQHLSLALRAENRMAWLEQHVLPELKTGLPLAVGIGFAPSLPTVEGNVWQAWMTSRTSLMPDALPQAKPEAWPFPDAILPSLPHPSGFTPVRRALVVLLLMTTAAGIVALCLSAIANRTLLRQVADDIEKYHAISLVDFDAKARQLAVLKRGAETLDTWYSEGEPLRFGLGLYPGERIRQPVLSAIRDFRPPEPKNNLVASDPVQTVRLNSMALFDVGLARLKEGSASVLVAALVNIRAKPGWLILVAGHTDTTGDEKANQHLSLRRAEAVRDWMLHASDIPATCFAVQGMGESQPVASNNTPEGRATNRRVEISLVPRTDACQYTEPKMPPDAAVSQRNQQGE